MDLYSLTRNQRSTSGAESSHPSSTSSSFEGSAIGSTTGSGTGTSKNHDRFERPRRQVEELVQRVVPEEMEHVDELMLRFRGREDELLKPLRTMQER
jgi:hypothetical protein